MPSMSSFASTIDLNATDNQTIDINANSKLRIKPAYDEALQKGIAEQGIEVIELQANASITPLDHDSTVADTFSDTTGLRNTVQVGTTTGVFSTNKYKRTNTAGTRAHGETQSSNGVVNYAKGLKIHANQNATLTAANVAAGDTATRCRIFVSTQAPGGTVLATATITDGVAAFSGGVALTSGTDYYIVVDNSGSNYTSYYAGSGTFPYTFTEVNITAGVFDNGGSWETPGSVYDIASIQFSGTEATKIIDCALGTITGTVTDTELICNCPDRETGDSVTYKLKNATQNDDNLALNTKNALTNLTSNPTGIEIELVPKTSSPTTGKPSVKTYCLKLWKA